MALLRPKLSVANRQGPAHVWSITTTDPHDDLPACGGCGRCCHQVVELVAGVDCVPEIFVVEHDGVRCMEQRGDGACVALHPVTRLCTIYENRPQTCRNFDRGGELCRRVLAAAKRIQPSGPRCR